MNRPPRRSPEQTAAIAAAIVWGGLHLALLWVFWRD
jgi:hypothetical protein